ncbi:ATP-binding protein [Stenotrophomonas muris]|uniref:ATP-binding protein n=1 Tax=Stenotrophomonas muris TaxID=2963283 RepID=UPI002E7946B3|nr:ATP-binding protein [Stenotrophomonas muris]
MTAKGKSIGRQISLSITVASLCSTVLSISGFYLFYYLLEVFYTRWYDEPKSMMPSGLEWLWIGLTATVVVALATLIASRLTRRIITPLNSVAASLRRVASGDLEARARGGDTSMAEAATLVNDFNSMAERLSRMSDNRVFWNAAIAHELRTPMTILRGRLQGIAEGVFEPGPEQFNSMLTQLEGLTRIIEDLRVVSLAESGHLDLRLQRSDVSVQVAAVVEAMSEALTESGFSVSLDARPSLADCDPARIRQAVLALLENARRHAIPCPLRVRVTLAEGHCAVAVEDGGPGVPDDLRDSIFEAFQRTDVSRSRQSGGSGLGLAVVRAIAVAHHGTAQCRATERGGSSFEIRWPVHVRR